MIEEPAGPAPQDNDFGDVVGEASPVDEYRMSTARPAVGGPGYRGHRQHND